MILFFRCTGSAWQRDTQDICSRTRAWQRVATNNGLREAHLPHTHIVTSIERQNGGIYLFVCDQFCGACTPLEPAKGRRIPQPSKCFCPEGPQKILCTQDTVFAPQRRKIVRSTTPVLGTPTRSFLLYNRSISCSGILAAITGARVQLLTKQCVACRT